MNALQWPSAAIPLNVIESQDEWRKAMKIRIVKTNH